MRTLTLSLAIAATFAAVPAMAEAPVGTRIEAQVGYDHAAIDLSAAYQLPVSGLSFGRSGLNYGGVIGYDLPVTGNVSLGVDAGIDGSTAKVDYSVVDLHAGRDYYFGGRATVNVAPKTNLYAIVGYANGRLHASYLGESYGKNAGGVRFGPGVQYSVGHEAYVSLQYDHTAYQDHFSRDRVLAGVGLRL